MSEEVTWGNDQSELREETLKQCLKICIRNPNIKSNMKTLDILPPIYVCLDEEEHDNDAPVISNPAHLRHFYEFRDATKRKTVQFQTKRKVKTYFPDISLPTKFVKQSRDFLNDSDIIYLLMAKQDRGDKGFVYVGKASGSLLKRWYYDTSSHTRNAYNVIQTYKNIGKLLDITRRGMSKEKMSKIVYNKAGIILENPPQPVDCLLAYAMLKGYSTKLFIVDELASDISLKHRPNPLDILEQEWMDRMTHSIWNIKETGCIVLNVNRSVSPENMDTFYKQILATYTDKQKTRSRDDQDLKLLWKVKEVWNSHSADEQLKKKGHQIKQMISYKTSITKK